MRPSFTTLVTAFQLLSSPFARKHSSSALTPDLRSYPPSVTTHLVPFTPCGWEHYAYRIVQLAELNVQFYPDIHLVLPRLRTRVHTCTCAPPARARHRAGKPGRNGRPYTPRVPAPIGVSKLLRISWEEPKGPQEKSLNVISSAQDLRSETM